MKCPDGTIVVKEYEPGTWGFDYPRLSMEVMEDFNRAVEIWRSGDYKTAERIYRELIEAYPEFIDAYHHLAVLLNENCRDEEALDMWMAAVDIGIDALAGHLELGEDQLPWGILSNRPFLRAFHGLGFWYYERGEMTPAHAIFSTLLAMNPNDNQGARALAIGCDFSLGLPEDVLAICGCYPDDTLPEVLYGRVLALYQLGRPGRAERALEKAVDILPLAAKELTKSRHPKPRDLRPDSITRGGHDEAYYYWRDQGTYWKSTPGALDFVKAFMAGDKESGGRPAQEGPGDTSPGFDINGLDGVDRDSDEGEEAFEAYQKTLVQRFLDSPEGKECLRIDAAAGSWAVELMEQGFIYLGVTPPEMSAEDAEEILTELIPAKVALTSEDEAEDIVPELLAFWEYLKREYGLPNADSIMKYLREIQPEFPGIMNDPSRFGMAKSLFTMGVDAGFDMTSEEGIASFMKFFNAGEDGNATDVSEPTRILSSPTQTERSDPKKAKPGKRKSKSKQRTAKAARKRNRNKRK